MERIIFFLRSDCASADEDFRDWAHSKNIVTVQRKLVRQHWRSSVFICSKTDWNDYVKRSRYVQDNAVWFTVTACNKQYVSEHAIGHKNYLGSMCEVTLDEARDHALNGGWYLHNEHVGIYWIAAVRNPDRVGSHTSPGIPIENMIDTHVVTAEPRRWPMDKHSRDHFKSDGVKTGRWPRDPRCPPSAYG